MQQTIPVTQEDFDKMVKELDNLKKVERPRIIAEITETREQGDLSENFGYHAARSQQGEIEARIGFLEDRISRATVMNHDTANAATVLFGATVKVLNSKLKKEFSYTLVSPDGVDAANGKISSQSPIGKALMGKAKGDKVQVQTPRGLMELEILDYT
jgi:transcription elongation factor GreA